MLPLVLSGADSCVIVIYGIKKFSVIWVRICRSMSCFCLPADEFHCKKSLAEETSDIQERHFQDSGSWCGRVTGRVVVDQTFLLHGVF